MDTDDRRTLPQEAEVGTIGVSAIKVDGSQVVAMRRLMHELSNVLTGVMISGGLLAQYLEGNALRKYAAGVCDGCERSCSVLRELRSQLLAACGEAGAEAPGQSSREKCGT